jgi:hypothetical protein
MYTHTHLFLGVVYHRVDPVAVFFRCVSICTYALIKQLLAITFVHEVLVLGLSPRISRCGLLRCQCLYFCISKASTFVLVNTCIFPQRCRQPDALARLQHILLVKQVL